MKAVIVVQQGRVRVEDRPEPQLRLDYIKVKTVAAGLNPSTFSQPFAPFAHAKTDSFQLMRLLSTSTRSSGICLVGLNSLAIYEPTSNELQELTSPGSSRKWAKPASTPMSKPAMLYMASASQAMFVP